MKNLKQSIQEASAVLKEGVGTAFAERLKKEGWVGKQVTLVIEDAPLLYGYVKGPLVITNEALSVDDGKGAELETALSHIQETERLVDEPGKKAFRFIGWNRINFKLEM